MKKNDDQSSFNKSFHEELKYHLEKSKIIIDKNEMFTDLSTKNKRNLRSVISPQNLEKKRKNTELNKSKKNTVIKNELKFMSPQNKLTGANRINIKVNNLKENEMNLSPNKKSKFKTNHIKSKSPLNQKKKDSIKDLYSPIHFQNETPIKIILDQEKNKDYIINRHYRHKSRNDKLSILNEIDNSSTKERDMVYKGNSRKIYKREHELFQQNQTNCNIYLANAYEKIEPSIKQKLSCCLAF